MFKIKVASVSRINALVRIVKFTKNSNRINENDKKYNSDQKYGGEYEIVKFIPIEEDEPSYEVANVSGRYSFSDISSLQINDPELFGTFKAGNIVELRVIKE